MNDPKTKKLLTAMARGQDVLLSMHGKMIADMCDKLMSQLDDLGVPGLREAFAPMMAAFRRFTDEVETASRELSDALDLMEKR